jgi:arylsulfatase A-like enzyme/cytochrome c-type biogenesis protein CcmH/NrfG
MMTRGRIGLAVLLVALAGTAIWVVRPNARPATNLLLITLDTTRADRLGCYGYERALTPALDRLAEEGLLFEWAYAPAPLTLPSHASLFTGLYPPEHGLRTNGRGRLGGSVPSLPAELKSRGYECGAFVASFVLDARFGLDRGFDVYDDDLTSADATPDALQRQRNGESVVNAALEWLRQPRRQPFFGWVHLYDPHFPYEAHDELFDGQFRDSPYDGEIAYVDRQVQRLIDHLESTGERDRTLVVVVGDHGEGLGEHVERTHGYTLYNATQHVPLILSLPDRIPRGQRVETAVALVDVYPTLREVLGLPPAESISGQSLSAAFSGQRLVDRLCYAATDDPFLQNGWSPLRSLTAGRWKYVRSTIPELYDLVADPGERTNLAMDQDAQRDDMARKLAEFEQQFQQRNAEAVQLSAAERKTLESLGYLGSPKGRTDRPAAELPDVKVMLPFDVAVQLALDDLQFQRVEQAIERLRHVVSESREHVAARVYLGQALEQNGEFDEAVTWYQDALRLKPDHPDALVHLGAAKVSQGAVAEAIPLFREALRVDPHSAPAHFNLGLALGKTGDLPQAIRQLDAALRSDDLLPNAHGALGEMLIVSGRAREAAVHLRREIELHPKTLEARVNLSLLEASANPEGAEQLLREALALQPEHPQALYNLGALQLMRGRPEAAIEPLSAVVRLAPNHPRAAAELERARKLISEQGQKTP